MKKIILKLVVLCLLLTGAPAAVSAESPDCPYDPHLSIIYNYMTDQERALYDRLYSAIFHGDITLRLRSDLDRESVEQLLIVIENEAPELCAFQRSGTKIRLSDGYIAIDLAYRFSVSIQEQFIYQVEDLAAPFRFMSDKQGTQAIRKYVIQRFAYGTVDGEDTQFAYYALRNNKAVCNGYSQTFAMLCHFAGYSCSYVTGYVHNHSEWVAHAWNVACIDDQFKWYDLTWDDGGKSPRSNWNGLTGPDMAETHRPTPGYERLKDLRSYLPNNVSYTMYLDVNDPNGYVRGVGDKNGMTVKLSKLKKGEYYSPALVIWNRSNRSVNVTVSYRLNDEDWVSWNVVTVPANSNRAFRIYPSYLAGRACYSEITWYYNSNRIGTFWWDVE